MSPPRIAVVGGGLAGLTAALDCADAGARVVLLEARPRLGGATWSARRGELWIDNGQHVFLRCFEAYLGLLERLGVMDRVALQGRLAVPVLAPGGRLAWLRRQRLPAPLHLLPSLLRFGHLAPRERLALVRGALRLARLDPGDPAHDAESFGSWLARNGQSPRAIERFWDLIARPTLNLGAADASLAAAIQVFQRGFLSRARACDLGYARVPLQALHAQPAARALEARGAEIRLRSPVEGVAADAEGAWVALARERIRVAAVVVAVTHEDVARGRPAVAGLDPADAARLGSSPILSLHLVYERPVTDLEVVAGVGTPVQYVFDRSRAAGLARGQYLTVTLSAADAWLGLSSGELRRRFEPELQRLFPAARRSRLLEFFTTCERAATFRQLPGTGRWRPPVCAAQRRIALAGAWTDTGWPATMEGAVRSGHAAARVALRAAAGAVDGARLVA